MADLNKIAAAFRESVALAVTGRMDFCRVCGVSSFLNPCPACLIAAADAIEAAAKYLTSDLQPFTQGMTVWDRNDQSSVVSGVYGGRDDFQVWAACGRLVTENCFVDREIARVTPGGRRLQAEPEPDGAKP